MEDFGVRSVRSSGTCADSDESSWWKGMRCLITFTCA